MKCHFDYDPARDSLIPCKEAGLCFSAGDLLQIVNQDDANWWQVNAWCLSPAVVCGGGQGPGRCPLTQIFVPCPFQACHVEGGSAGLIPSQLLEEKRKAFVKRDLELTPTSGMRVPLEPLTWDLMQACLASLARLSVARDPVWQPFRKEKEANDVFDYQERRCVLETPFPVLSHGMPPPCSRQ